MAKARPDTRRPVDKKHQSLSSHLGDMRELSSMEKIFFNRATNSWRDIFSKMPKPRADDWLSSHREVGQNVTSWKLRAERYISQRSWRERNKKIYIVPLGEELIDMIVEVGESSIRFLDILQEFAAAFFAPFITELLNPVDVMKAKFESRINSDTGRKQILVGSIVSYLEKKSSKIAKDAFCIVAVTMIDLYPKEDWNFVFGQAHCSAGIGAFSFARYDPRFFTDKKLDFTRINQTVLWRSLKVMSHEISHLFCLNHCIFYSCAMNGSNHLEESDRRPLFYCPICLCKMKTWIPGISIKDRYQRLHNFCSRFDEENFVKASHWLRTILDRIETETDSKRK